MTSSSQSGTGCSIASELLAAIARSKTASEFREHALAAVGGQFGQARVAWVHQHGAHWEVAGSAGSLAQLPIELAASSCEQMSVLSAGGWLAVPIAGRLQAPEVLLLSPANMVDADEAEAMSHMLRSGLVIAKDNSELQSRVEQLQTLLQLAADWQQSHDLTELLSNMAVAAARVLHGDRASIFLWDKSANQLVGHPAMGVEGGDLRIRDDQGIAGLVLKSGQAERWDMSGDPGAINAKVGQQLGYTTRSLVAVPLLDRRHRPLGVFEVLNHRSGQFTSEDERFLSEMARHAAAAVENTQHIASLIKSRDRLVQSVSESLQLIGDCPQIRALRDTVARVAPTELAVLILGENGTGKEVIARSLHLQSNRRDQAFVAVNCAAIAETLLESELFGHEKGAFTDAVSERAGKFELATGGTLLLDEIGEMSVGGQAKLLRVLEDKVVVRVGGSKSIQTDVRVIAATNQDLVKLVREKRFREDLYFRLNVVTLQLPPMRERGDDVIVLAEHFLQQFGHQIGRPPPTLSAAARKRLLAHAWPGNVRELRNLMERVAYLTSGPVVEESDLAFVLSPLSSGDVAHVPANMTLADATSTFQRQYIARHVESASGNLAAAAKQLGMHRSNLYRKMQQLGMSE
ncbi:MAG: sigma-54-dependent Fis family transcriptional regulator [Pirellulaceae bacterium]|jgi:transcriptional regulator with GAF, ATPase, and Fis domain|nr:sigma-54-dependent Fis family transcriptional regulator [Pirellulaceae bacterium]